jgi:signal transduction histidine kinase
MGGQVVAFQSVRIRKDKSVVNISFIGLPLINNGEVIAAYGIYRDISIEKKAEEVLLQAKEKAEESDRLKSAFLATMSHELRTPLNAIIGFSSLIDESYNVIEILDYLKIINQSGNHLLGIINDMFHLSVLEAGEININRSYFKPALLFLEVMDIIGSELNTHNKPHLKLVYNSVPDLDQIEIFSDYQKIEQVLMIFLKNSIKFTDEGFIEYGFYLTDKDIVFYVKDSGVGIAPEKLNVIFEKFRQADETSTRTFGGIGIGLTIARELVNILKGSIFVESTLSAGSNFGFSISRTEAQVKGVKTTKVTGSDLFEGKRVLVAEDEESNFLLLDSSLKTTGVTIFRAYNGKEAVDFVHRNPAIDLILMDLKMPVLDGFIATTEIRKAFPQIPIIAQTAYAMVGDRAKAIQAGCDDYISKPIRRDALIALMKKYIR